MNHRQDYNELPKEPDGYFESWALDQEPKRHSSYRKALTELTSIAWFIEMEPYAGFGKHQWSYKMQKFKKEDNPVNVYYGVWMHS